VQRTRIAAALACLVGLALVAAACGGDDSGTSAASTTASSAGGSSSTAATAAPGSSTSTTAGPQPQSIGDWEALWAKQRDAIVQRIKSNHWGKSADGKTLTGPEGWTVDLSKCAPGWSDIEGLSDTKIKIGQSIPLSGTYADYGNIGKAMDFLFGYYSDQNFFKDVNGKTRRVEYKMLDDGYDAARAIPNVDELLDSEPGAIR
jgi:ABC-type branched-subunit amino acid transport system substrate-binding protein